VRGEIKRLMVLMQTAHGRACIARCDGTVAIMRTSAERERDQRRAESGNRARRRAHSVNGVSRDALPDFVSARDEGTTFSGQCEPS
jgi:hypothetical protein